MRDPRKKVSQQISLIDELVLSNSGELLCQLFCEYSSESFSYALYEPQRNKYLALEKYTFPHAGNEEVLDEYLQFLLNQLPLLQQRFSLCSIAAIHAKTTLIPEAVYDEKHRVAFFKLNHDLFASEELMLDNIKSLEAKNVFSFSALHKQTFQNFLTHCQFHHFSTPLIEYALREYRLHTQQSILLNIQAEQFEILVMQQQKLSFYNSFAYKTPEDFIYFLLYVMEQVEANPETTEVRLIGAIERKSSIYALLQKYIRVLSFGKRLDTVNYSYKLNDLPGHYFVSLLSQHLCVS